ncbi:unnamed protein product [Hymenolepis diminuta]|uniref:Uncharacterized protein n=1 Tax=Hymenolepis diminuta TaxID=6216 RepID=A0A564Z924_HYMDI|nr:unnamed protein product [Hymenolepis diminuta]
MFLRVLTQASHIKLSLSSTQNNARLSVIGSYASYSSPLFLSTVSSLSLVSNSL